jgi:hypothetical protein
MAEHRAAGSYASRSRDLTGYDDIRAAAADPAVLAAINLAGG